MLAEQGIKEMILLGMLTTRVTIVNVKNRKHSGQHVNSYFDLTSDPVYKLKVGSVRFAEFWGKFGWKIRIL